MMSRSLQLLPHCGVLYWAVFCFLVGRSFAQTYHLYGGHYYLPWVSSGGGKTFEEADALAKLMGGYLVLIDSAAENSFVNSILTTQWSLIGAIRCENDPSVFCKPGTNTPILYSNWRNGEPNNNNNVESCTVIMSADYWWSTQGQWNDVGCTWPMGWVFEFDQMPTVSTNLITQRPSVSPTVTPLPVYRKFRDHYYYIQAYVPTTFSEASSIATSQGGYIVRVDDSAENDFVLQMIRNNNEIPTWLGFERCNSNINLFCYSDTNTVAPYVNFATSEGRPSNTEERCVNMYNYIMGTWNDNFCNSIFFYIVEFNSQPAGATGLEPDEFGNAMTTIPTGLPTVRPSRAPTTASPTRVPTIATPTRLPTVLPTLVPTTAAPTASWTYRKYNGHYYYLEYSTWTSWDTAQSTALSRGGYLATINDAGEAKFLLDVGLSALAVDSSVLSAWVGIRRCLFNPNFFCYTDTSSTITYTNWAPGEPNSAAVSGQCVELLFDSWGGVRGLWNDHPCSVLRAFVVEFDGQPMDATGLEVDEVQNGGSSSSSSSSSGASSVLVVGVGIAVSVVVVCVGLAVCYARRVSTPADPFFASSPAVPKVAAADSVVAADNYVPVMVNVQIVSENEEVELGAAGLKSMAPSAPPAEQHHHQPGGSLCFAQPIDVGASSGSVPSFTPSSTLFPNCNPPPSRAFTSTSSGPPSSVPPAGNAYFSVTSTTNGVTVFPTRVIGGNNNNNTVIVVSNQGNVHTL